MDTPDGARVGRDVRGRDGGGGVHLSTGVTLVQYDVTLLFYILTLEQAFNLYLYTEQYIYLYTTSVS